LTEEDDSEVLSPLADCYNKLRSASGKALLEAESKAARAMAEALPRKLSANGVRGKRVTKPQK
jgi:hypothetical protein